MNSSKRIFSPEALSQMLGGAELTRQVVRVYAEELPGLFDRLSQAVQKRDVKNIGRLTHSLKGSLAMLASHELAGVAATISDECLGSGTAPTETLNEFLSGLRQLQHELNDYLGN